MMTVARRMGKFLRLYLVGFGAHFVPKVGLLRAVTEHNQMVFFSKNAANPEGKATFSRQDMLSW